MTLSASTVKQYARHILRLIQRKRLPVTLSKSSWGVTRAAISWVTEETCAGLSEVSANQLRKAVDAFLEEKAPQFAEPAKAHGKVGGYNSKIYSAASLLSTHEKISTGESWREILWAAVGEHHRSAIACLMIMPLRPADLQKGVTIKVIKNDLDSPWAAASIASGESPPTTIEFLCRGAKLDGVQYFDTLGDGGMVQTELHKGQKWRRFLFKVNESPWLRWLQSREGILVDLGRLQHARSLSQVIKKAGRRAGYGDQVTAYTLRHLVISEYRAFESLGEITWEEVCRAAGHSSAATTKRYGSVAIGKKALKSNTLFEPPAVQSEQPIRQLKKENPRLETLDHRAPKSAKRSKMRSDLPPSPLASPSRLKPKGF